LADRDRVERRRKGRVHVGFDDRQIVAGNQRQDVRGDRGDPAVVEMQ